MQVTSCDYRVSSLWPPTKKADKLYPSPDMLAAVQTGHKLRTSAIIPTSAGHLCLLALSEAVHGTTQY